MSLQDEYPWQDAPVPTLDERIAAVVRDGVSRSKQLSGSVRDALLNWGEGLLTRQALRLATAGLPPDGVLGDLSWVIEAELAEQLAKGDSLESLHGLWELLPQFAQAAPDLGWYRPKEWNSPKQCFADPELPALLVGRALARQPDLARSLLPLLESQQEWAPVGWALVHLGNDPSRWLEAVLLQADNNEPSLTARIAWACAALGGAPAGAVASPIVANAFVMCISAMAWLCPAASTEYRPVTGTSPSPPESPSPWLLSADVFLRSILYLAHASTVSGLEVSTELTSAPPPIERLSRALGFRLRMTEVEYRVLVLLCCPQTVSRRGGFDDSCWSEFGNVHGRLWDYQHGRNDDRSHRNFPIVTPWVQRYLLPALWQADTNDGRDLLLLPRSPGNRPLILMDPARLSYWVFLYRRELSRLPLEKAASGWIALVQSARWRLPPETGLPAVEETRQAFLAHHGETGWIVARSLLRELIPLAKLKLDADKPTQLAMEKKLLEYMNLSFEDWKTSLNQDSSNSLRIADLLMAGAPVELLSELFLRTLATQQTSNPFPDPGLQADLQVLLAVAPMSLTESTLFERSEHFKSLTPEKWRTGQWLDSLLTDLPKSPAPDKPLVKLTRHLARQSEDEQVRVRALRALLSMEEQHAAS